MAGERNPRGPRLDREAIIGAAITLLNEQGLADLTMRRLAAMFDVQPSALYWHFENKQSLLAAVADVVIEEAEIGPDSDAAGVARAIRAAILQHRDAAEIVLSTIALDLGGGGATAAVERALRAQDTEDSDELAAVVMQFALGNASVLQQQLLALRFGALSGDPAAFRARAEREFERGLGALLQARAGGATPTSAA